MGNTTFCKFGDITVRASLLSMEELMCQAPALDQGAYPLEVAIDGISSNNGAKYHAAAYTTLDLVSKPHVCVSGGSRLRFTTQNRCPRSAGRLARVPGGNPHRSRIRRSG